MPASRRPVPRMMPVPLLRHQLELARAVHGDDLRAGYGAACLPDAIAERSLLRRNRGNGRGSFRWKDENGLQHPHHLHESVIQRAVKNTAREAGLEKRVTCHTFRVLGVTRTPERGRDIRTVQELLGHRDVTTTMIYTHVLQYGARGVRSPLDAM